MATIASPSDRRRFFLFVGAGVVNTCFGYAAFAFFIWLDLGNDFAVLFGMMAGVAFNFGTISAVFSSRGFSRFPYFVGVYSALLVTNILMLRALVASGFGPYLGEAIVITLLTPISFVAMRRLVFVPAPEQTT
jgi:hypothetical protein